MREPGFYWVKYKGEWVVAQWFEHTEKVQSWYIINNDYELGDQHFEEIDERRITREETIGTKDKLNFSDWLRENKEIVDQTFNQSKLEFETYENDGPSNVSVNHLQISSQGAFQRGAFWALRSFQPGHLPGHTNKKAPN
jgi:hypothetical protein